MGSKTLRIPFINFCESDLKQGSPRWNSIKSQVIDAAVEYGCFEAAFPSVSQQLLIQVYGQVKELFELPEETKRALPHGGFMPAYVKNPTQENPLYQSIGFTDGRLMENVESIANVLWPQGNTTLCQLLQSYTEKVAAINGMVRQMIAESFGIEKYLEEQNEFSFYDTRPARYDAPKSGEAENGLLPHVDVGYLVILSQNQTNGLQVQLKDASWIDVNPSPYNFVVLFGEAMRVWTNDRLHAVKHRVMMTGGQPRYSINFSSDPIIGYRFMTPKELIDEDHSARCEPYEFMETLQKL